MALGTIAAATLLGTSHLLAQSHEGQINIPRPLLGQRHSRSSEWAEPCGTDGQALCIDAGRLMAPMKNEFGFGSIHSSFEVAWGPS